jgi:hypothetical protein
VRFDGAVIEEQGVTFGVAIVKSHVLNSPTDREDAIRAFTGVFGGIPTILMAQDSRGTPTYFGRNDIVDFMAGVPVEAIPWSEYTVS